MQINVFGWSLSIGLQRAGSRWARPSVCSCQIDVATLPVDLASEQNVAVILCPKHGAVIVPVVIESAAR